MLNKIIIKLKYLIYKLFVHGRYKKIFKKIGNSSFINKPLKISGHQNINIGENVFIGYKSWLAALPLQDGEPCVLEIGNNCQIGNFNHIYSTKKILIGQSVLTADKVYISDNLHSYENIYLPVMMQPVKQNGEVKIGDGTWLGENVCVLGVSIGKNCVVGANAVVTKDIPDYSVAVGNPTKIIKRYCLETKEWKKTTPDGNFLN